MTDSATLRPWDELSPDERLEIMNLIAVPGQSWTMRARTAYEHYRSALLASHSSWAKEKEELERQLAEADRVIVDAYGEAPSYGLPNHQRRRILAAFARHASRSATAKE